MNYIVTYGNINDGFCFVGPFTNYDSAQQYVDTDPSGGTNMWIAELLAPASGEVQS